MNVTAINHVMYMFLGHFMETIVHNHKKYNRERPTGSGIDCQNTLWKVMIQQAIKLMHPANSPVKVSISM